MPATNAPKMTRIEFSVPTALLEQADAIADLEGWKPSELYRVFWVSGFSEYAEGSNQRILCRLNQKALLNSQ